MATKVAKDSDVHVTYEDQQKINKFARHNARLQDMKEELEAKKKELQNLEDAADELLMLEDETEPVAYMIGEVFVHCSVEETNEKLEAQKENFGKEISDIERKCEDHKQVLSDLKIQLYAKFGNSINLEADEES